MSALSSGDSLSVESALELCYASTLFRWDGWQSRYLVADSSTNHSVLIHAYIQVGHYVESPAISYRQQNTLHVGGYFILTT